MNVLFIKHFCVGFIVSDIRRMSVFGHCPYSVTFPYVYAHIYIYIYIYIYTPCKIIQSTANNCNEYIETITTTVVAKTLVQRFTIHNYLISNSYSITSPPINHITNSFTYVARAKPQGSPILFNKINITDSHLNKCNNNISN